MISEASLRTLGRLEHGRLVLSVLKAIGMFKARIPEQVTDEFISAGLLALVLAHNQYDPSKFPSFVVFAYAKVLSAMLDERRKPTSLYGRVVLQRLKRLSVAEEAFRQKTHRAPSRAEMGKMMRLDEKQMNQLFFTRAEQKSDGVLSEDFAAIDEATSPHHLLVREERQRYIRKLMRRLPPYHESLIKLYFLEDWDLDEIAAYFMQPVDEIRKEKEKAYKGLRGMVRSRDRNSY